MKKYKDGGDIPQEAKNKLMDREQEREREAFMEGRRAENEAPKKAVKDIYDRVRGMFGVNGDKKPAKKAKGGKVGSASKRADGCAQRGKTKGRMI